ncbi:RidA family protein [Pedobacter sp. HMF7647]|uniref:RidA family protein n=1 Tax=Hufsiella arboris TaxID=2695275 RepID=A0A7K1Y810_9SPHI|nr:RidA family protein [Hufsiella arboris]MXV50722.1 RidA family protein [Hufsiella arboris]
MKKFLHLLFMFACTNCFAQTDSALVKFNNPPSVPPANGYSQSAEINLGNCKMLIISGQVALNSKGELVGAGNMRKQADQVFKNIRSIVDQAGGSLSDLVKISFFVTDLSQLKSIREVRNEYINLKNPPASTLIQVKSLFRDDLMIEIEATAILPLRNNH